MNKIVKRILVIVLAVAIVVGAVFGVLVLVKNSKKSAVNVYSMENFVVTDYWGDSSSSYGMVTADKLQNIYLSDTMIVQEIHVTEGQEVKQGDPLVSIDTTLSDIALEKAETQAQKTKLNLEQAREELEQIKCMTPHYSVLVTPEYTPSDTVPQQTPLLLGGTGTLEDPFCFLWGEEDLLTSDFLWALAPKEEDSSEETDPSEETVPSEETTAPEETEAEEETEPSEPKDRKVYVMFVTREENKTDSRILGYFGMMVDNVKGELRFRPYNGMIPEKFSYENIPQEPYYEEYGSPYTASEIAKMRSEKEHQVADLEIQLKAEEVQLKQMQEEVNNGIITAKLDGVVRSVLEPDAALAMGMPLLQVSGGGGYYIHVSLSELEMNTVRVGQTVNVSDWSTGGIYEGTVTEISPYPTTDADSWGSGNTNVSYYPFTVFVDDTAQLREGNYAEVSYQPVEEAVDGFYLEKMFLRSENGQKYVFVRGENGKLEKRFVVTGKTIWDSHVQILGGLSPDEFIAFPYGKNVEDGASTKEASVDELYR